MSKIYKIRWRESDLQELQRVIKNFNAKLYRIEKKNPENMPFMPEKLTKKQVMDSITTRKDFNRLMNKYKRFSVRGAEEIQKYERGVKATKWDVDEYKRAERADNIRKAKRKKFLDEQEVTQANKPTGNKRKEMGSIKENEVRPSNKNLDNISMDDWKRAKQLMDKKILDSYDLNKKKTALLNYIKGLINEGYSDRLIDLMNSVPVDKFIDVVDTDVYAQFDFIYDPIERDAKEQQLLNTWEEHAVTDKDGNNVNVNDINVNNIREELEKQRT